MEENQEQNVEHIENKGVKVQKAAVWKALTAIFAILFIASIFTHGLRFGSDVTGGAVADELSAEEAQQKALDYINENLLQEGVTAEIKGIEDTGALYSFKLNVGGREFDSYMTKDGALLFPSVIDMNQVVEAPEPAPAPEMPKQAEPEILMFVMSFCPYGQQAENGLKPVADLLQGIVDVEPHYVIYQNYRGGGPNYCFDEENKYCSMHGIKELQEDIRQLCIWEHDKDKFWPYVEAIDSTCSLNDIDECWEGIAEEQGIDVDEIKTCFDEEAPDLLEKESKLNADNGVSGSPTIIINGQKYSGARTPDAFKQGICSGFEEAPEECSETLEGGAAATTGSC